MEKKSRWFWLWLLAPCLLLAGIGTFLRGSKDTVPELLSGHELGVQSVNFPPVKPQEAKQGYDFKAVVTVLPEGKPPQLPNRQYVSNDIRCCDTPQLFSRSGTRETLIKNVEPKIHVKLSNPIEVSFLFKRRELPPQALIFRTALGHAYSYQRNGNNDVTKYETRNRIRVPIEFTLPKIK